MKVYREQLLASLDEQDSFSVRCWPERNAQVLNGSRVQKMLGKYLRYSARVFGTRDMDIVHFLDHSSGYLIPFVPRGKKIVATLHDLIPLRYPADLSAGEINRFRSSVNHLKKCDALISVSQYSKEEAVDLLGIPADKIHVVPNGVNAPRKELGRCSFVRRLRERGADCVVLSVGSHQPRKNLKILPQSLKVFEKESGLKVALLRVGTHLDAPLRKEIAEVCGEGFFLEAGRLPEESLWSAYYGCDVVIVPSLYEGFGLPVIEAFACGKGVASSNRSSLPEVGGQLAEYFDPDSPEEAGKALARVASCRSDSDKVSQRLEAVCEVTWRRHLEGVLKVYESLGE